eukprot:4131160-Pyramimonas_sp.AAC.1
MRGPSDSHKEGREAPTPYVTRNHNDYISATHRELNSCIICGGPPEALSTCNLRGGLLPALFFPCSDEKGRKHFSQHSA